MGRAADGRRGGAARRPRVNGVRDSKLLTETERERLFDRIAGVVRRRGRSAAASQEECDELGMAEAQRLAARRAHRRARRRARRRGRRRQLGLRRRRHVAHVELRVKADASCLSVAAASILAKVDPRPRSCATQAEHYPHWRFDSNKGYPCPMHKAALQGYGPSAIHRRTWVFMDHYCRGRDSASLARSRPACSERFVHSTSRATASDTLARLAANEKRTKR